jgi:hypothetical protein
MSHVWMNTAEAKAWQEFYRKQQLKFLKIMRYQNRDVHIARLAKKEDPGKLAYIKVGNTQRMAYVTLNQQIAYKMQGMYERTKMKWSKFTFIRWCTSFDT